MNLYNLPHYDFLLSQMQTIFENSDISTFTGELIDVINPDPSKIRIEDIAHALSQLCRFGGHSKTFYSVAQHSIAVSYLVPEKYALEGLLHDSTEAFMVDLPRPIKNKIALYKKIENNLYTNGISKKFNLLPELPEEVHQADNAMIVYEWFNYMDLKPEFQSMLQDFKEKFFKIKSTQEIENEFITRYEQLLFCR